MLKKIVINTVIFLSVILSYGVNAKDLPVEQLKSFLAKTNTLTADFKQVTLGENGQVTQTSQGLFYLSRPGKFRWSYQKPFQQEIISNVGKVWFYDADLEQVTIKKLDDSLGSTPALLLSGKIDLEQNFTIQQQGIDEDMEWIKLSPKNEDSGFNYILIGMEGEMMGGMELSDSFGQLTRIYFSNVKQNIKLDAQLFEFIAPEGVDVFEN